jgi:hypothetical protein
MNAWRGTLARSLYLSAIVIAMAGWILMLFEGVEWIFGV